MTGTSGASRGQLARLWVRSVVTRARSLVGASLLILVVLTIVFVAFNALGSDPVRNALGVNASESAVASLRHELGYDRPVLDRYLRFIVDAVRLDFGRSIHSRQPVRPMLLDALYLTLRNGLTALGVSVVVSLGLTALAFSTGPKVERAIVVACRVLTSVPSIVVAVVIGTVIYVALGGFAGSSGLAIAGVVAAIAVYPTCSLGEIGVVEVSRLRQATFVTAARAMGMSEPAILFRCIMPVILTSVMGHVSNIVASIAVVSAVFEVVFSLPGIGSLLARSITQNDLPIMQGVAVVIVILFLTIDAVFDRLLLPRLGVYVGRAAA